MMSRAKRIFTCLLVLVLLVSTLATTVYAYEINCGSGGSSWQRTYKIYKAWGSSIKISRMSSGTLTNGVTNTSNYGKFTYSVKNASGSVVASGTWNAQTKSSVTLVGAFKAAGYYTVTVSKATYSTSLYTGWVTWPKYKLTW